LKEDLGIEHEERPLCFDIASSGEYVFVGYADGEIIKCNLGEELEE